MPVHLTPGVDTPEAYDNVYGNGFYYSIISNYPATVELPDIWARCCTVHADALHVWLLEKAKKQEVMVLSLEEIMPEPTESNKEITHFEMEMSKTPEGTKVFIKSPFVEALMRRLSRLETRDVRVGEGWPGGVTNQYINIAYVIPNPPIYIAGIYNNWRGCDYPIVYNGFNPACLTLVGIKDGLTFLVQEPMSAEAQDVFSDLVGSCISQLMEGFGNTSSKRAVKIVGTDEIEPVVNSRRRY